MSQTLQVKVKANSYLRSDDDYANNNDYDNDIYIIRRTIKNFKVSTVFNAQKRQRNIKIYFKYKTI